MTNELRYVIRPVAAKVRYGFSMTEPILQIRYEFEGYRSVRKKWLCFTYRSGEHYTGWTEWRDVPTVKVTP